jgi:hypothetical protein
VADPCSRRYERPAISTTPDSQRWYRGYAAAFLGLTLLSGVWLRMAFVWPEVLGSFRFGHVLHAHSHVAFFGWTSMALFAAIGTARESAGGSGWRLVHAHFVGIASAAAFLGFLVSGYAAHTIAISAVHVVLWIWFAIAVWPLLEGDPTPRGRFHQTAIVFLVVAGAGAMAPGIAMATRVADPWLNQLAVQSFLTPFMSGWLLIGAMGAVYAKVPRPRFHAWVLCLTGAGVLPSTLLHPLAPPPEPWLLIVGRAGTLLLGIGALLFAAELMRWRGDAAWVWLVAVAALGKGGAEVAAAAMLDGTLLIGRPLTIAYLHLVLLGLLTPALVATALRARMSPSTVLAFGAGIATMLLALVASGWPAAGHAIGRLGIDGAALFRFALIGGAVSAAALLPLLVRVIRSTSGSSPIRPTGSPVHSRRTAAGRPNGGSPVPPSGEWPWSTAASAAGIATASTGFHRDAPLDDETSPSSAREAKSSAR